MKFLGIDFGTKHVGLATSDDGGVMAFPHSTLDAKSDLVFQIGQLVLSEQIGGIVIGEPGKENALYKSVHEFVHTLTDTLNIPVYFQNEAFTSMEASRFTDYKKPTARLDKQSTLKKNDASAAALILQRYLDRKNMIQSKHDNDR